MKIKKIHIDGFGKLHNFDIEPGEGINIFFGYNEAGKSTLHLFIRSILYGASTKRRAGERSVYERMRPWKEPELYRGRIEIEFEKQRFLVERDFNKAPDDLVIYELKDGKDGKPVRIAEPGELLNRALGGLSETAYLNTVSSGQLGTATKKDMAAELRRYASNISVSLNPKINAERALEYLRTEKQKLNAGIDENAVKEYTAVLSEIKKIEESLELPENDNKVRLYSEAADRVRQESDSVKRSITDSQAEIDRLTGELTSAGFRNEEDIDNAEKAAKAVRDRLEAAEKKAFGKGRLAAAVLLLLCSPASGVYGALYAAEPLSLIALGCAAAAALCAILLLLTLIGDKKKYRKLRTELTEFISVYTAAKDCDEEELKTFEEHIARSRELAAGIASIRQNIEKLDGEQARLNSERAVFLDNLEIQQQTRTRVEEKLVRLKELMDRAAALRKTVRINNSLRENTEAIEMAEETIGELAASIKNAAGTYINKEASSMVSALTGNVYDSISAGMDYDIKLNSPDGMISVSDMSAGTADQVYLAVRLATVRFMAGEDDPLPLILDDSFNLYDDERLTQALSFLAENYRGQILIFTCQNREEEALTAEGIAFRSLKM